MSSTLNLLRKLRITRRRAAVFLLLALALTGITGHGRCLIPGRVSQLHCAVDSHAGFGHLMHGMNMYTIDALDEKAGPDDIWALQELLLVDDRIAAMTAAEVLKKRGKQGLEALKAGHAAALAQKDTRRAALIEEYGELNQKSD